LLAEDASQEWSVIVIAENPPHAVDLIVEEHVVPWNSKGLPVELS
jgi:hypothetical protein